MCFIFFYQCWSPILSMTSLIVWKTSIDRKIENIYRNHYILSKNVLIEMNKYFLYKTIWKDWGEHMRWIDCDMKINANRMNFAQKKMLCQGKSQLGLKIDQINKANMICSLISSNGLYFCQKYKTSGDITYHICIYYLIKFQAEL